MADELVETLLAAKKFGTLKDIEAELANVERQRDAALKDAAAARVESARLKAQADLYLREKQEEAEKIKQGLADNHEQVLNQHQSRLASMEANAKAVLESIEAKLTDKHGELGGVMSDLEKAKDALGKLKSAFEDAKKALGL